MAFMCEACVPRAPPNASSSHFTAWVTSYLSWMLAEGVGLFAAEDRRAQSLLWSDARLSTLMDLVESRGVDE